MRLKRIVGIGENIQRLMKKPVQSFVTRFYMKMGTKVTICMCCLYKCGITIIVVENVPLDDLTNCSRSIHVCGPISKSEFMRVL